MKHGLHKLSLQLACAGVRSYVVEAMAVRSREYEVPILEDVHAMAQCIRRALKNVPGNFDTHDNYKKPYFTSKLSLLGCDKNIIKKYGDLDIAILPGTSNASAMFYPKALAIHLTYVPSMVDSTIIDYRPVLRSLDTAIEHELRHFVDYVTGLHKKAMDDLSRNPDKSHTGYYSSEHEIDARLTSLFIKINSLFKGSALLALQGKIDAMTKKHRELLMNDYVGFWSWILDEDRKLSIRSIDARYLDKPAQDEVYGKTHEFWMFLKEAYGMALRIVKADKVTKQQKKAWDKLHAELRTRSVDQTALKVITKIAKAGSK